MIVVDSSVWIDKIRIGLRNDATVLSKESTIRARS